MPRKNFLPVYALGLLVLGSLALTGFDRSRTVVFVVGDSIAIEINGWVNQARRTHWKKYKFIKIPARNARSSEYTLENLESWLPSDRDRIDVIVWNNGLHDITWRPYEAPGRAEYISVGPTQYEANLHAIASRLKQCAPNVVFLTSTPVRNGMRKKWNEDIEQYNAIARGVMDSESIPVIDLHEFCETRLPEEERYDGVHWIKPAARKQAAFIIGELENLFDHE